MFALSSTQPDLDAATIRRLVPGGLVQAQVADHVKKPLGLLPHSHAQTLRAAAGLALDLRPHCKGHPIILRAGVEVPEEQWLPELQKARDGAGRRGQR